MSERAAPWIRALSQKVEEKRGEERRIEGKE
jgi:hypothetical protein